MREIEFRGLSNGGSWAYGVYVDGYIIDGVIEANDEYITIESWIPVDKNTVSQYTGLEDANRVPIYEGDIVEIDGIYNSIVEFFDGGFVLRINGEIYPLRLFSKKVVGNIYGSRDIKVNG